MAQLTGYYGPVVLICPFCPHCGAAALWTAPQEDQRDTPVVDQVWWVECSACSWRGAGKRYGYIETP